MIFTHSFANSPASLAAIEYKIEGPVTTTCTGDTSAATAIQYAFDVVRWGRADIMLAGGADALSEPLISAINAAGGLPGGAVAGEGACLWVLEGLQAAEARGARVLAELLGVGLGSASMDGGTDHALLAAVDDAGRPGPPEVYLPSGAYGHTFGASAALHGAAAMSAAGTDYLVSVHDPNGRAAAMVVRTSQ